MTDAGDTVGRPPRGGRGLKSGEFVSVATTALSPPSRGAWIEITVCRQPLSMSRSPPSRGAWIEIQAS